MGGLGADLVRGVLSGRGVLDWVYLGCYARLGCVVPLGQEGDGWDGLGVDGERAGLCAAGSRGKCGA